MQTVVTVAIIVLAGAIVILGGAAALIRVIRTVRQRRQDRLAAGPRRALLAFVADSGESGADELLAIPPRAWQAVEPVAVELLGKVRGDAHLALTEVFQRRGVGDRALAQLTSADPVRRARAAETLGHLRRLHAVPQICALLDDRQPDVRVVAARALGTIGEPAAAVPLLAALTRPVPAHLVAHALARIGAGAVPALEAALSQPEPLVRATALDALGLIGATGSVPVINDLLHGEADEDVRLAAVRALGRLGGRSAVAPLLAATEPGNSDTLRAAAARALGDIGAASAGKDLARLMADPAYPVAHEAAQALRRIGPAGLAHLTAIADASPAERDADVSPTERVADVFPTERAAAADATGHDVRAAATGREVGAAGRTAESIVGLGDAPPPVPVAHARQALALAALTAPAGRSAPAPPTGPARTGTTRR
ncbi:HEAT repeat protein [Krasilnikovia cinnamomea]|uniref:HEAT repeat protein n=1 Tax=Krasilnikovia cinnamomea TaxID=349313 RepID=A0A4Q7ZN14_9ACTN|nr:HEAT repeat domain-containing protein [Krasilnikovia cinnamomea]RZU51833.1 HEAT repeat protein [Krasilnikovia cinnamomea]